MRLFARPLSSVSPACRARSMGGTGRRKWTDLFWVWTGHRCCWRKSRTAPLTLAFVMMLLWLFLISVLNLETGIDRYSLSEHADGVYSTESKAIAKRVVYYGDSSLEPHGEGSRHKSESPDIVVEDPRTDKTDIKFERDIREDSISVGAGEKLWDYDTKRKRHFEDHFDIIRKIPGRRIQGMRLSKSWGLEHRKASNWIGSRSVARVSGRGGESIASSYGKTNTRDLEQDQYFYETSNEAYGKTQYRLSSSFSSSSSISAAASATDANAGERTIARVTPGSISTFEQPTNWRKLERARPTPGVNNSASATIFQKRNIRLYQKNPTPSHHRVVQTKIRRSDNKIINETSQILKVNNSNQFSPKTVGEFTDVDYIGRAVDKVLKIDNSFPVMESSDINLLPHQAQIMENVDPRSKSNNKLSESGSDYLRRPKEIKDSELKDESTSRRSGLYQRNGENLLTRIRETIGEEHEFKYHNTVVTDDSVDTSGHLHNNIIIDTGDRNDVDESNRKDGPSPPIHSSHEAEYSDGFIKTNSPQTIDIRSEGSKLSSISQMSSATLAASSLSTTNPSRASIPDSSNLGMNNEIDNADDGNLNVAQSNKKMPMKTPWTQVTTTKPDKNWASQKINGLSSFPAAFIRADTSDKKITYQELKKIGSRDQGLDENLIFMEERNKRRRDRGVENINVKSSLLLENERRDEGDDRTAQVKVEKRPVMTKLSDKNSTLQTDISRDDSVNSRQLINVTQSTGNRELMMTTMTVMTSLGRDRNDDNNDDGEGDGDGNDGDHMNSDKVTFRKHIPILRSSEPLESDGFTKYAYNVTASDLIGSRRDIPDTRPQRCANLPAYGKNNSNTTDHLRASVVICFHNEAVSVLLRTLQSLLDRTPAHLIDQVILIDDFSSEYDLVHSLPNSIRAEFGTIVTLTRTEQREGLVRARLLGARLARSEVLVFLDAHVECNVGWLEPLLFALKDPGIKVVSPYIDTIKADSFEYRRSPAGLQGGFNWRLEFGWRAASSDWQAKGDESLPIRTPVISGGLFAVRRQTFHALGEYDSQLEIWGGENFELSFKTWMCGGSMEILPCSRVGHVFRASLPYTFKDVDRERTVLRNLGRVAMTWMDEYAQVFEAAVNFPHDLDIGDVTERIQVRDGLHCKSFQWYLKEVNPQLEVVSSSTRYYGQVKNKGSLMCLEVTHDILKMTPVVFLSACKGNSNQTFHLTSQGQLKIDNHCIVPGPDKSLTLSSCRQNITWIYMNQQARPASAPDLCMTSVDNERVQLLPCGPNVHELHAKTRRNVTSESDTRKSDDYNNSLMKDNSVFFQYWEFQYSFHWKRKRRRLG